MKTTACSLCHRVVVCVILQPEDRNDIVINLCKPCYTGYCEELVLH